jgi:hypothetical protein
MSARKPVRPDVSQIAESSRTVFGAGLVARGTALDALYQVVENMRSEFHTSDEELEPIIQFIAELKKRKS